MCEKIGATSLAKLKGRGFSAESRTTMNAFPSSPAARARTYVAPFLTARTPAACSTTAMRGSSEENRAPEVRSTTEPSLRAPLTIRLWRVEAPERNTESGSTTMRTTRPSGTEVVTCVFARMSPAREVRDRSRPNTSNLLIFITVSRQLKGARKDSRVHIHHREHGGGTEKASALGSPCPPCLCGEAAGQSTWRLIREADSLRLAAVAMIVTSGTRPTAACSEARKVNRATRP